MAIEAIERDQKSIGVLVFIHLRHDGELWRDHFLAIQIDQSVFVVALDDRVLARGRDAPITPRRHQHLAIGRDEFRLVDDQGIRLGPEVEIVHGLQARNRRTMQIEHMPLIAIVGEDHVADHLGAFVLRRHHELRCLRIEHAVLPLAHDGPEPLAGPVADAEIVKHQIGTRLRTHIEQPHAIGVDFHEAVADLEIFDEAALDREDHPAVARHHSEPPTGQLVRTLRRAFDVQNGEIGMHFDEHEVVHHHRTIGTSPEFDLLFAEVRDDRRARPQFSVDRLCAVGRRQHDWFCSAGCRCAHKPTQHGIQQQLGQARHLISSLLNHGPTNSIQS